MYNFRLIEGSTLEEIVSNILENPGVNTKKALVEMGYHWHDVITAWKIAEQSDNFSISRHSATYTDVVPQTTIINEADVVNADEVSIPANIENSDDGSQILWPDAPEIDSIDNYSWFKKPKFYDRMSAMVDAGKHISLAGPPGIGKSSAIEYMAAERGIPLVNISADAGLRRRDLVGNTELVNSHTQFQIALYLAAAKYGWWVKIDEVNAAEPDALMFINSQIAPPYFANYYGKQIKVHENFRLFVTYNPGLVGTKPLPPAFKDRFFPIKLEFPTASRLSKMLVANGMPVDAEYAMTIVNFGVRAWESHKNGRMRYQITPRRLMDTVLLCKIGEDVFDALSDAVVNAVDNHAEARVLNGIIKSLKSEII